MATETITFTWEGLEFPVDLTTINGKAYAKASSVAKVLDVRNIHTSTADFDQTEKLLHTTITSTGERQALFLSNYGLIRLCSKLAKPMITSFKPWVLQACDDLLVKEQRIKEETLIEQVESFKQIIEDQKRSLTGQEDSIYAFKLDATQPYNTLWKLGKSSCTYARKKSYTTLSPHGKVMKVVTCHNMSLAEKNLHALMTGLGCQIRSECYDIPDPDLLYAVMDLVGHMDRLADPTAEVNLSHIQHLVKQYATVFETPGALIRDRRDIFLPNARTPIVRLDPDTRQVLETFRGVNAAKTARGCGNCEVIRQAIEKDEILSGFRYREWREGDPPLPPPPKSSNKQVWKRDMQTKKIIEIYSSREAAASSNGLSPHNIKKAMTMHTVEGGYLWTDHGNDDMGTPMQCVVDKPKSCVEVKATDRSGNVTTTFASVIEAANATGFQSATISQRMICNAERRDSDPPSYTRKGDWLFEYAHSEDAERAVMRKRRRK